MFKKAHAVFDGSRGSMNRLNRSFDFVAVRRRDGPINAASFIRDRQYVSVVCDLRDLVAGFGFFTRLSLADIVRFHGLLPGSRSKMDLQHDAMIHVCVSCHASVYTFKSLTRDRPRSNRVPLTVLGLKEVLDLRRLQKLRSRVNHQALVHADEEVRVNESGLRAERRIREAGAREALRTADIADARLVFPTIPSIDVRNRIIREWQEAMNVGKWLQSACAVCGQKPTSGGFTRESASDIDLSLLRNAFLPEHVLPTSYNFAAYDEAILCVDGMHNTDEKGELDVCDSCRRFLIVKKVQPVNALANFQYYGNSRLDREVSLAFKHASMFDLMLVSRCRATRMTYLYSKKKDGPGGNPESSQRYNKGNVAIIPQDSVKVRLLLPPGRDEIRDAMCALFIGGVTVPTVENIKKLNPIMVSKSRVFSMINFLVERNPWYSAGGAMFSRENFDDLFHPSDSDTDMGLLKSVELAHLPSEAEGGSGSGNADYTDRSAPDDSDQPTDVVMDVVGYTEGDRTPQNYRHMKAVALAWCTDRKKYIRMRGSASLLDSKHPGLLTYLFPHLDPWGIGGFFHEQRRPSQYISFEAQVKNMLNQKDSPFEGDPNFAYVCWNLIQRASVNKSMCFRISRRAQQSLARDLQEIGPSLVDVISKWDGNPAAIAITEEEKKAVSVMNRIKLVAIDLKGSSGAKMCYRNEIRSLNRVLSTPALFLTVNPADVMNPLMGTLGGVSPDEWVAMRKFDRSVYVARRPGIGARFFDIMIRAFIRIVIRPGESDGYFGCCKGYYGMVEAQGKGTLHLHFLLWLEGNPNPQVLRDRMIADPIFKERMFAWLEAIISCELPGMTDPLVEVGGVETVRPVPLRGTIDPRMKSGPILAEMSDATFEGEFKSFVTELAVACNWHVHQPTCWKHLKIGEARGDSSCRMRINGMTRAITELDDDTLSILLRRLHPRINNYNELMLFLLKCNMDIKFIGSGQAAKALVFYVTDYITKSELTTHAGLDALLYAIKASDKTLVQDAGNGVYKAIEIRERGLLIKSVNAMMARQEMSHQQVMSYLVGGGDRYTGHTFQVLRWREFDEFVRKEEMTHVGDAPDEEGPDLDVHDVPIIDHVDGAGERRILDTQDDGVSYDVEGHVELDEVGEVTNGEGVEDVPELDREDLFTAGDDGLEINSQILDYRFRALAAEFSNLTVWEFVTAVVLIRITDEEERLRQTDGRISRAGRKAFVRGRFSGNEHPRSDTHMMRMRTEGVVPVLLGRSVGRPDGSQSDYVRWCRAMLILFKPWRSLQCLKRPGQSWVSAYEGYIFPPNLAAIMKNFGLERECKDARDEYSNLWRQGRVKGGLIAGLDVPGLEGDEDSLDVALVNDFRLDDYEEFDDIDEGNLTENAGMLQEVSDVDRVVKILRDAGLFWHHDGAAISVKDTSRLVNEDERPRIEMRARRMAAIKKNKRPRAEADEDGSEERIVQRPRILPESVTLAVLDGPAQAVDLDVDRMSVDRMFPVDVIDDVIKEFTMQENEEQVRAVKIIGEHVIGRCEEQLLMYVGGSGGTGKSHVINAIVSLFKRCGRSDEILLAAPTGCAAVLIGGYTVHALTMLPQDKKKINIQLLEDIWRLVLYLIIDEASMLSAKFLSDVSSRIAMAKAWDPSVKHKPFGGVNIIFLGDMGQLKPVRALSMFNYSLVDRLTPQIAQNVEGQSALHGAFLWRSVDKVVLLKKNMRAIGDPLYTAVLERVRMGITNQVVSSDFRGVGLSDYDVLKRRMLSTLSRENGGLDTKFRGAPIIVADKVLRDAINDKLLESHASSIGEKVSCYRSADRFHGKAASGEQMRRLWRIRSTFTKDAMGLLNMFVGMHVMITENVAISQKVVNGAVGIVTGIDYEVDMDGHRRAVCVFVRIPGSGMFDSTLGIDIVPVVPIVTRFSYVSTDNMTFWVTRKQVPLIAAYSFTDYKSQGRGMVAGIVDLAGARSPQSQYVMLSRVKSLNGLALLRSFAPNKLQQRLSAEFRKEFARLDTVDAVTTTWFANQMRA